MGRRVLAPTESGRRLQGPALGGQWGAVRAVEGGGRWVKSRQVMKVKKEPCERGRM